MMLLVLNIPSPYKAGETPRTPGVQLVAELVDRPLGYASHRNHDWQRRDRPERRPIWNNEVAMNDDGREIVSGVPLVVGMEYHKDNWSTGLTVK